MISPSYTFSPSILSYFKDGFFGRGILWFFNFLFQGVFRLQFNSFRKLRYTFRIIYLDDLSKNLMDKFISYYLQSSDFDLDL